MSSGHARKVAKVKSMNKTRRFLIITFSIVAILTFALYLVFRTKNDPPQFRSLKFWDWGSITSLMITFAIVLWLKVDEEARNKLNKTYEDNLWRVGILILASIGLIGIWLAIRSMGLLFVKYLVEETSEYLQGDIFTLISFILTANLCFTLLRTFATIGEKEKNEGGRAQKPKDKKTNNEKEVTPKLIDVAMQVLIIGLITFIPRYYDQGLLSIIGSSYAYVTILLAMIIALAIVAYVRWRLSPQKHTCA